MFGEPLSHNPMIARYLLKTRKKNYPKSLSEWKYIVRRTRDKYLWTFEGFLIKEQERDEYGNIITKDEKEDEEDSDSEDNNLKDKAADAANQISDNVQKNISTIKEEAPKLLKMGQEMTGISTREELREWVGEQLKLGTACLSEFMKGYRKGRDDEVDRMLHEYFKDLDEKEEATLQNRSDKELKEGMDDESTQEHDAKPAKKEKRLWGRRERRRSKVLRNRAKPPPNASDVE